MYHDLGRMDELLRERQADLRREWLAAERTDRRLRAATAALLRAFANRLEPARPGSPQAPAGA